MNAPKTWNALRFFGGGIATETNVFSPIPTGLSDFATATAFDSEDQWNSLGSSAFGMTFEAYRRCVVALGGTYAQGFAAVATPAGITTRSAYESLRTSLIADLSQMLPVAGVLLTLHGAMVADGYIDCESDLVMCVRDVVGETVPIGVLLDLHCDLPDELVKTADVIVAFKEYPHVDVYERAAELARLTVAAATGKSRPTMATYDCRMIGLFPTSQSPMDGFVQRMKAAEQQPGILSVSLGHGFPWGDAPAMGARTLVVADEACNAASELAVELGSELFSLRHEVGLRPLTMGDALDEALSLSKPEKRQSSRPVVVADMSDNCGGGAPGDSTFVLRELLEREVRDVALALLWDPIAVQQAFAVGEDSELRVRLGGKMGPSSGDPLDLDVRVLTLASDLRQRAPMLNNSFAEIHCGACARFICRGIDIVVSSVRQQVRGLEVFTALGIEPSERRVLVVKSTHHFHTAYAPIAEKVIHMDAPGALTLNIEALPYRHVDKRKFPWIDDPWVT